MSSLDMAPNFIFIRFILFKNGCSQLFQQKAQIIEYGEAKIKNYYKGLFYIYM